MERAESGEQPRHRQHHEHPTPGGAAPDDRHDGGHEQRRQHPADGVRGLVHAEDPRPAVGGVGVGEDGLLHGGLAGLAEPADRPGQEQLELTADGAGRRTSGRGGEGADGEQPGAAHAVGEDPDGHDADEHDEPADRAREADGSVAQPQRVLDVRRQDVESRPVELVDEVDHEEHAEGAATAGGQDRPETLLGRRRR